MRIAGGRHLETRAFLLLLLAALVPISASAAGRGEVLRLRGESAAAAGRCDEAVGLLEQARAADPSDTGSALTAGKCLVSLGRYRDAISSLRDLAQAGDPGSAEASLYLAIAKYHLEDFDAAAVDLDRALAALPDRAEPHLYVGLIALQRGQTSSAVSSLARSRIINADAVEPIASFYEGLAQTADGESLKARAALERARDLGKGTVWESQAAAALAQLDRGKTPSWKAGSPRDLEVFNERSTKWWLSATVGFEYDDNVVLRGQDVGLPSDIGAAGDERAVYWAEAGYELFANQDWTVGVLASYYGTAHDDLEDFDIHYPGVSTWVDRRLTPSLIARIQYDFAYAFTGDAWVGDSDSFLRSHTWTPALYQDWGDLGNTRVFARLALRNYLFDNDAVLDGTGVGAACPGMPAANICAPAGIDEDRRRNRDGFLVITGFDHTVSTLGDRTVLRGGYHFHNYDSRGGEYSYTGHELQFGVRQRLPWEFTFEIFGSYIWKPYTHASTFPDPEDLLAGVQYRLGESERHDQVGRVDVSLERPITDNLTLATRYSYLNNASNVHVFDYDRHVIGVYATLRFSP